MSKPKLAPHELAPKLNIPIAVSYPDDSRVLHVNYETPPVGWVLNPLTNEYEYTGVYRRSDEDKECYWQIDPRFELYKKWRKKELEERKTNKDYNHPELAQFIKECWRNRLAGFWFRNNNEDTYISGAYWYMISVFEIDTGAPPNYNQEQRNLFLHWDLIRKNPNVHGLLVITQRRGLKTYSGACIGVEQASRRRNFRMGIQSKTEDDAKKVFNDHVFLPFRTVPYFFLPEKMNLPRGSKAPATGLKFNSGNFSDEDRELLSVIDFRSAEAKAYDGYKLKYYYADEVAKTELDVYQRWQTVKKSLEDHNRNIIGKSFQTTTVEDINPNALTFMRMWSHSNQFENKDGITKSGLHKHFIPAHKMQNANKYGKVDAEANLERIYERRYKLRDDVRELAKAKRQDPLNEIEAFTLDEEECRFNPIVIGDRITELTFGDAGYEVGNLVWRDGKPYTSVDFVPNPNGKFFIKERPTDPNRVIERYGRRFPDNKHSYAAGSDTYDHRLLSKNIDSRFSLGSTIILKKPNPFMPTDMDYGVVCFYLHRPESPEIFYEDTLKATWWYGCENMVETNKPGLMHYYEDAFCEEFIPIGANGRRGVPGHAETNNYIASLTEQYINNHISKVYFVPLLQQWKKFKPENTREFDAAMAFGYAYILLCNTMPKQMSTKKNTEIGDVISIMRRKSLKLTNR